MRTIKFIPYILPYGLSMMAKEKGFSEDCLMWYHSGEDSLTSDNIFLQYKNEPEFCFAPIYQQIIDWLREKHRIAIEMQVDFGNPDSFGVCLQVENNDDETGHWTYHPTYYGALNNGIEKALKLLK